MSPPSPTLEHLIQDGLVIVIEGPSWCDHKHKTDVASAGERATDRGRPTKTWKDPTTRT